MTAPTSKMRAMVGFLGAAANSFDVMSGAVDIIVLRCNDGTLRSSPFICRFGRFKCIRSYEKIVRIEINGELNPDVYMKIGSAGEAYFIVVAKGPVPAELLASPLGSPGWNSPRSPCNSSGSSPLSSPGLPPSCAPSSPPNMSLSGAPGHLDFGKSPAMMPKRSSEAGASSSSSSSSPPAGPADPEPRDHAAPPRPDEKKEADEPLPPLHGGGKKEQFDVDLLFKKLSGVADTQTGAPHLSASDGCSPEETSKAATMASDHLSLPISPDMSRSSSPLPPMSPAVAPPPLQQKVMEEEDLQDDGDLQFDDLLVDDGYRGLNDADLLASDSDGQSDYPTEMTLQKTTFPSSAQLQQLRLKDGENTIRFVVKTTLRGLQQISARIYLWPETTKLVVSDVDGTVTRSDVWGQILPQLGYDWTHTGICQLYTSITDNGYKMLYLSSRSVSQAAQTRSLLTNVKQGGFKLPDGPLIVSPDRIFRALAREVILRKPEEFKIAALKTVRDVFPNHNPFYAGFGNRDTDFISYREVSIPAHKIFTINCSGLLSVYNFKYESYTCLHELVHHVFPPIKAIDVSVNDSEFDTFNFWSLPIYENASTDHLLLKLAPPPSNPAKALDRTSEEVLPYEWQWVNSGESQWSAYSRELQRKIEAAFQSGKPEVSIQTPKGWYTVVFKSSAPEAEGMMHLQRSDKSKKQRSVRRAVKPDEFVGRSEQTMSSAWNFWRRTSSITKVKSKVSSTSVPTAAVDVSELKTEDVQDPSVTTETVPEEAPRPAQPFKVTFSSALLDDFTTAELQEAIGEGMRSHFRLEEAPRLEVFTQHAWVEVGAEAAKRIEEGDCFRLRGQKVVFHRRKMEAPKAAPAAPAAPRPSAGSPASRTSIGATSTPASPTLPVPEAPANSAPSSTAGGGGSGSDGAEPTTPVLIRPKALSFTSGSPMLETATHSAGSRWFGWLKGSALGGKSPPTQCSAPPATAVLETLQLDNPIPSVAADPVEPVSSPSEKQESPPPTPCDEEAVDAVVTPVVEPPELLV